VLRSGFPGFLCHLQIPFKDFGAYVNSVSNQLKEAAYQMATAQHRPIHYLSSSATGKQALAQKIAAKDGVRNGLIALITRVEPCMSFIVRPNHETKKLEMEYGPRKCLYIYHYLIDPEFGFMNARIQTWFPFQIQIFLNGGEWLAHQMDKAGIRYKRLDNCFSWIEDFAKAQKLMDRKLRTAWPSTLDRFARRLNPIHRGLNEKRVSRQKPARSFAGRSHLAGPEIQSRQDRCKNGDSGDVGPEIGYLLQGDGGQRPDCGESDPAGERIFAPQVF
jgi:hypothetical protein